jgi:MOSC domain-containing protein YiiM
MYVVSVNVGLPRVVEWHGRNVETAIWKEPVEGRVAVQGVNLVGDGQADLRVHGGPDKAVYSYALEDYSWWSDALGRSLAPGTFGENLTFAGVDLSGAEIGSRWRVGSALLEVSQPRFPCFKLGIRMRDAGFVKQFARAARFGAYFRIVDDGEVGAGDLIELVGSAPAGALTIREVGVAGLRRAG